MNLTITGSKVATDLEADGLVQQLVLCLYILIVFFIILTIDVNEWGLGQGSAYYRLKMLHGLMSPSQGPTELPAFFLSFHMGVSRYFFYQWDYHIHVLQVYNTFLRYSACIPLRRCTCIIPLAISALAKHLIIATSFIGQW